MERTELEALLKSVRDGETPVTDALNSLSHWPTRELGHSRLDLQRASRCGQAEVVFGAGKTPQQLREIGRALLEHHPRLLVTRVSDEGAAALLDELPDAQHAVEARAVWVDPRVLRLCSATGKRRGERRGERAARAGLAALAPPPELRSPRD